MHENVILEDDFTSKFEGWGIIVDEEQKSFIKDDHYWMENKSKNRWMFYHKKIHVSIKENFIVQIGFSVCTRHPFFKYFLNSQFLSHYKNKT